MTDDTKNSPATHSDALVLFGFTGDLANKKIFPALYAMAKRGELVPRVVGVAGRPQTDEEVHQRVRDSIEKEGGGIDDGAAFDKLQQAIRYVGGDYNKPETFEALKKALDGAKRPAHYLAVPPTLFETVIRSLGSAGLAQDARLIVEKPFGRDLASAKELDAVARSVFPEDAIFRIDHYLGKEAIMNLLYFRFANSFLEPLWCRDHVASVQMTMSEDFGVGDAARSTRRPARCATWWRTTCSRSSRCWRWSHRSRATSPTCRPPRPTCSRRCGRSGPRTWCAASTRAIARRRTWRPTPTSRPTWRCVSTSTPRAGRACRSTCAPARSCPTPRWRCRSSSGRRRRRCSRTPAAAPTTCASGCSPRRRSRWPHA